MTPLFSSLISFTRISDMISSSKIVFKTPIYHPNVNTVTGQICNHWHDAWSPQLTIEQFLIMVRIFLKEPNLEQPLEAEIAAQYTKDKVNFNKTVQDHTK